MNGGSKDGPRRRLLRKGIIWLLLTGLPIATFALIGEEPFLELLRAARRPAASITICWTMLAADVLLPVPSSFVAVEMGRAAGAAAGSVLNWTAITLGHCVGFMLARRFGRAAARRFVGERGIERAEKNWEGGAMAGLILTRPIPIIAEAAAMYAGLTDMSLLRFVTTAALANIPHSAAYAWAGANLDETGSLNAVILAGVGLPALAFLVLSVVRGRRVEMRP